jgi:hypothetical protein
MENTPKNTTVCAAIDTRDVSRDIKIPPLLGGSVRRMPGLKIRNRSAGTIKSATVRLMPRILAMAQYAATKMRELSKTSCTDVFMDVKTPGLRTMKSRHGTRSFSIIVLLPAKKIMTDTNCEIHPNCDSNIRKSLCTMQRARQSC